MLIKVATGVWEVCWMQGGFVIRPTAEVSDFIIWSAALPLAYKDIAAASIQQACIYSAALWHCPESCYRAFCWWNVVITGLKPLQPIDYSEFEPTLMRCLTKSYLTNVFGSFQRSSPTCSFGETLHYYKQVLHGSYPSSQHCSYAHLTALGLASKLATFECSTMWWYVSESPPTVQ